jgi:phenylalanyl-tRNA synthetase beta chain
MKLSTHWLADYLPASDTPEALAHRITLAGHEVEEILEYGHPLPGVVIGKVLEVSAHPNADRLRVCQVDVGSETVQIVCGAPNVAAGQTVAVATVGTRLPLKDKNGNLLEIQKAAIRGVESVGMICAEDELGIGEDHSGILVLEEHHSAGMAFDQAMQRRSDQVLELSLTPNRPDATCHLGIARDLSAVYDLDLLDPRRQDLSFPDQSIPATFNPVVGTNHPEFSIEIKEEALCHRYVGVLIRKVSIAPSPSWLQHRLKAIGLRPINNVVDATNYVLHELGQPLHAFDLDHIHTKTIRVQTFEHETSFTTLDSQTRKVPAGSLFICDGDTPVALAGIMGGENSEVQAQTQNILLESAWFEPVGIRRTSKQLALQTDASYRFERGVDATGVLDAALRCARLIAHISGGEIDERVVDLYPVKTPSPKVHLRHARLEAIIGMSIEASRVEQLLGRLGFRLAAEADGWQIQVPGWRPDVEREIDLIEEVARIIDYNAIPAPAKVSYVKPTPLPHRELFLRKLREMVSGIGFREIQTISLLPDPIAEHFVSEQERVRTLNPISIDQAVMRPDLRFGFLRTAAYNFNRAASGVALFEMGNVFRKSEQGSWIKGIAEDTRLLIGISGEKQAASWHQTGQAWHWTDLKAIVMSVLDRVGVPQSLPEIVGDSDGLIWKHNGQVLVVMEKASEALKAAFDLKQDAWMAEFHVTQLETLVLGLPEKTYQPISKFPKIEYDAAFIVDAHLSASALEQVVREHAGENLKEIYVFDVYEGKGIPDQQKSIAFRMHFLDPTKTLTITDVDHIIKKTAIKLEQQFGARLRS